MINVTTNMLLPGETTFEAAERIRRVRLLRRERRAPIDKLAERDRLTRFWKDAYPQWQLQLCRIAPNFALVHVKAFRRGMRFGHLSLLPGHVPGHLKHKYRPPQTPAEAPAQFYLFT